MSLIGESEKFLKKLASDIDQLLEPEGAFLHTVQFVSYSPDVKPWADSGSELELLWQTLSRDLEGYGEAVRKFIDLRETPEGKTIVTTSLVDDDFLDQPYWKQVSQPENGFDAQVLDELKLRELKFDSQPGSKMDPKREPRSLEQRLAKWFSELKFEFNDIPFTTYWITQPHRDPRLSREVFSSIFLTLVGEPKSINIEYRASKLARDFMVNYLIDHFSALDRRIRAFRVREMAEAGTSRGLIDYSLLSCSQEKLLSITKLSTLSGIPVVISGMQGTGKSATAHGIARAHIVSSPKSAAIDNEHPEPVSVSFGAKSISKTVNDLKEILLGSEQGQDVLAIVIDDIHRANRDEQRELYEIFTSFTNSLLDDGKDSDVLIIVTADNTLPALAKSGSFSESLWRKLSVLTLETCSFFELSSQQKIELTLRLLQNAFGMIGDASAPDQNLAEQVLVQFSDRITNLSDLRDVCLQYAIDNAIEADDYD